MVKWNVEPFPGLALHPNPAPHQLHEFCDYGQTQTRSAVFASNCRIDLGEGLEETIHLLR